MNKTDYIIGALHKARLDLVAKEYEYAHNGMRINFELSIDEIDFLLHALKSLDEPIKGEQG